MVLYHKAAFVRRMVPNIMKLNGTNVPLNPVVSVPKHLKADVVTTLAKQLKQPPTVISPEELGTLKRQRRNSMPATSTISTPCTNLTQTMNWTTKLNPERRVCFKLLKVLYKFDKFYSYNKLSTPSLNKLN